MGTLTTLVGLRELASITTARARAFCPIHSGGPLRSLARAWLVPALWPVQAVNVAAEAGSICAFRSASMTLRPTGTADQAPARAGVVLAGVAPILAVCAVLVLAGLSPEPGIYLPALALFLLLIAAVVVQLLAMVRTARRHPAGTLRALTRRSRELGESSFILASLVATTPGAGDGAALVRRALDDLPVGTGVVLYPATDTLVDYYARLGFTPDAGAGRRMIRTI